MIVRRQHSFREWLPGMAFAVLAIAYHAIFSLFFPLPNGLMGHDYSANLPYYLDGFYWFKNNGVLPVPWFSPSFCGGQVFFADPQSAFYSVPQFLVIAGADPVSAVYASVLLFAGIGYWGMYALARRFGASEFAAVTAAALFMFNGFYSARMIIGHINFQGFMLVPAMAALSLERRPIARNTLGSTLICGLLLAYCLQSGLTSLMLPAGLSVLALGLLAWTAKGEALSPFLLRFGLAGALALALCASKLAASLALMAHFPRTDYLLPGFDSPSSMSRVLFHSFFRSGQAAFEVAGPLWRNLQWAELPHEMAFGVTPIPLVIAFAALASRLRACPPWRWSLAPASRQAIWLGKLALLCAVLLLPLALLYYSPEWNAFLKRLPLVGATSAPQRWLVIYLPLLALLAGLAADVSPLLARLSCFLAVVGLPLSNGLEDRDYYYLQSFDPAPVVARYREVEKQPTAPPMRANVDARSYAGPPAAVNARMAHGLSSLDCYNPLYGYRLEHFQREPLVPGPMLASFRPGSLNVRNPACLLYPEENHCRRWDVFKSGEEKSAQAFISYRPFPFERSIWQKLADGVTGAALLVGLACVARVLLGMFAQCHHRVGQ